MSAQKIKIGIIGGSGLEDPEFLENYQELDGVNKFGRPSSKLIFGRLNGTEVVFLSRHGRQHAISPTDVPFLANALALKEAGCTHLLATTACGSLKAEIKPGDFVFVDQFIDFTKHRTLTLFKDKIMHTAMAEPFCPKLRKILTDSAKSLNLDYHSGGTIITVEGPRFSTKAESEMFRQWGAEVINMSTVPEVILARELGLCYQSIAMATDYDCWKEGEEPVTAEMVFKRMEANAEQVKRLLVDAVARIQFDDCPHCRS
ncbi:MAG TPA: S-methyl-5'-thioadenosine phosphorylase [Patescibacteria group bacterium]|nr:S-methyl-5'-thioadenosine phosphorylase [Patescibacteria group bacterium]